MDDDHEGQADEGDDAFDYGCMKQGRQKCTHIEIEWAKGTAISYLSYCHSTCHYFHTDRPEVIRFRTLNDEVMIEGYNLAEVYEKLKERKISVLRESPPGSDRQGGQPVILKIEVDDNT